MWKLIVVLIVTVRNSNAPAKGGLNACRRLSRCDDGGPARLLWVEKRKSVRLLRVVISFLPPLIPSSLSRSPRRPGRILSPSSVLCHRRRFLSCNSCLSDRSRSLQLALCIHNRARTRSSSADRPQPLSPTPTWHRQSSMNIPWTSI